MKGHKLISMVEFVKEQIPISTMTDVAQMKLCRRYANFLSQILEIWMFVPAIQLPDGTWEVLIHPDEYRNKLLPEEEKEGGHIYGAWEDYSNQYQQAKERVLFEGFDDDFLADIHALLTVGVSFDIEELERWTDIEITLTKNAIKTIYG